jgi:hemerythrin
LAFRYHQKLIELSSMALDYVENESSCRKTLRRLLDELLVYIDAHFQVEEASDLTQSAQSV